MKAKKKLRPAWKIEALHGDQWLWVIDAPFFSEEVALEHMKKLQERDPKTKLRVVPDDPQ